MRQSTLILAASLAMLAPIGLPGTLEVARAEDRAEASRHFQLGVRLYAESKFDEALIEFERAYELSPHPSVLYNIAASHRERSHYGEAILVFERFLSEGERVVRPDLLARARVELGELRGRIGSVIVDVSPAGVVVTVDGREVGITPLDGPVILGPGRHTFTLRAPSGQVESRSVTIAAGDTVTVALAMTAPAAVTDAAPDPGLGATPGITAGGAVAADDGRAGGAMPGSMGVSASFGSNVRRIADTGAPALGGHLRLGSRVVVGADVVLAAWAVIPSLRVRLAGDRTAVHAIAAVPVNIVDQVFVAGAAGLGLRVWASASLAIRLEALASFAGDGHGLYVPVFMGVELWR